ncbi:MAG TPA: hypothetical protein VIW70_05850 [Rubrivivax sp.]
MKFRFTLAACLIAVTPLAGAQTPSSPAKKELVQKILVAQQAGIEAMGQQLAEQPAARLMQQVGPALQQRVPADKREAVAKEIQADFKKYADEAVPIVRERAVKLAPSTIGAVLEEKFSEDELKQVLAMLESPVNRKFQSLGGEMQRSLGEKLVADTRPMVEGKLQTLERSVARRLGIEPPPAGGAATPGPRASAPAKK